MSKYRIGVWIWGFVGFVIAATATFFVFKNFDTPDVVAPVLATLVATIGVVWSWFFQTDQKERHHNDMLRLEREKLSASSTEKES